jgi:hypothetical protein
MKKNVFAIAALALLSCSATVAHAGRLAWSGRVDGVTVIRIHGRDVSTQVISGKGVENERYFVTGSLHRGVFGVRLMDVAGRGRVHLVRRPGRFGGNTVAVRISDPQPGNAPYHFTLTW